MGGAMTQRWSLVGSGLLAAGLLGGLLWVMEEQPLARQPVSPPAPGLPQRIVSVNITSDEILLDLAPERLLAVSYHAADPAMSSAVREAEQVPLKMKDDVERLLLLAPDLVVIGAHKVDVVRQIEEAGVPVVRIQGFESIEWIRALITTLGLAVGRPERARHLVAAMDVRLAAVARRVERRPRPSVLYYSPGGFTGGRKTTLDDVIRAAGGENVASRLGVSGWKRLSLEQAVLADPEVILLSDSQWWTTQFDRDFAAHPAFRHGRAVRGGRVYVLPSRLTTTASHHVVETVETLARLLHPDAFPGEAL